MASIVRAKPPTHDYEPLEGGTGKEIHFRQARNPISDLLDSDTDIEHAVHFESSTGVVINFGINGVAFSMKGEPPPRDHLIEDFRVVIGSDLVYRGRASTRYYRLGSNGTATAGVVLLDGILDTDVMVAAKNHALATKATANLSLALNAGVSTQYKEAMADLVLLMSSYRTLLDGQERSIRALSTESARRKAQYDVLKLSISTFSAQYQDYRVRCNQLTNNLSKEKQKAYRHYTEAVLHPHIRSSPLGHHCYDKPLGYPGDFMLMSYLYDPQPYGETMYDKLIHQVVIREEPMAIGVQRRKDFLLGQICDVVANSNSKRNKPVRVLSLACGPAQEVLEFAATYPNNRNPVEITLIDQDQRALTHVNSCLSRLLIPGASNVSAKYLFLGFMQIVLDLDVFDELPQQDLIYAAGLYDYIRTASAQQLTEKLFGKLTPGGRLVIGNFKSPNDATWALEYWMDWHLLYRTHDDMVELAELIEERHTAHVTTDASGYTNMLVLTRG